MVHRTFHASSGLATSIRWRARRVGTGCAASALLRPDMHVARPADAAHTGAATPAVADAFQRRSLARADGGNARTRRDCAFMTRTKPSPPTNPTPGRHKLLQMMLDDAAQTKDDPAGRYVLLRRSPPPRDGV